MKTFGTGIAIALLAGSLTGCSHLPFHNPQQAQAPPLQTGQGEIDAKEKAAQAPPPSNIPQPSAQNNPPQLPPVKLPKAKRPKKRKSADSSTAPTQQAAAAPPGASTGQPAAGASPIGQLTTGNDATGAQEKYDTAALIQRTEEGLAKIKRPLSADEQVTAEQIRTFLKQAKQALDIGDSDGAETLATKAKLLLDELTKS